MTDYSNVEGVVDADVRIEDRSGPRTRTYKPDSLFEVVDNAYEPLDRSLVEEYQQSIQHSNTMGGSGGTPEEKKQKIEGMRKDFREHIKALDFVMELTYEDGDVRQLKGSPRTDIDYNTGIFPSIIPFQFEDSSDQIVFREMERYPDNFVKYVAREADFTGNTGFDWNFFRSIGTDEYDGSKDPDTFAYVPEPYDWMALHGYGGIQQTTKDDDEIPMIADPVWTILDVDESDERMVGIRPWYNEIWGAGISEDESKRLGRWRGINRTIGRWIHDMDDEFVHAGKDSVVFYDNEFPHVVGSPETSFDGDIWDSFWNELQSNADDDPDHLQDTVRQNIREEELRLAEKLEDTPLKNSYRETLPRNIEARLVPEDKRATDIF